MPPPSRSPLSPSDVARPDVRAPGSPAPAPSAPGVVTADVLARMTTEVGRDVLAAQDRHRPELRDVRVVLDPTPAECRVVRCQPLPRPALARVASPGLDPAQVRTAHLHQPSGVPGRADLALVADLIGTSIDLHVADHIALTERARADHLTAALASNRTIGTAVGVLMALRRLTVDEALGQLKAASQNHNRKLRDLAADVVLTGALPERPRTRPDGHETPTGADDAATPPTHVTAGRAVVDLVPAGDEDQRDRGGRSGPG